MRTKLILTVINVASILLAVFAVRQCQRQTNIAEVERANVSTLIDSVKIYRHQLGYSVAEVGRLRISADDNNALTEALRRELNEIDLQLKRAQAVAHVGSESNYNITTTLKDSVNGKTFDYSDRWIDLSGNLKGDSISIFAKTRDSILMVVHRVPRKFLFFKFGTKAVKMTVVSKNPNSIIKYTNFIEFTK
jgi:hypothetical protein